MLGCMGDPVSREPKLCGQKHFFILAMQFESNGPDSPGCDGLYNGAPWKGGCASVYSYQLAAKTSQKGDYQPISGFVISQCVTAPTPFMFQCDDVLVIDGMGSLSSTEISVDDEVVNTPWRNPQGWAMGTGAFKGITGVAVSKLTSKEPVYAYEYKFDLEDEPDCDEAAVPEWSRQ
eukprot:jgi/Mesvir1/29119/Mv18422-RA.1